jgi:hypothetical protein
MYIIQSAEAPARQPTSQLLALKSLPDALRCMVVFLPKRSRAYSQHVDDIVRIMMPFAIWLLTRAADSSDRLLHLMIHKALPWVNLTLSFARRDLCRHSMAEFRYVRRSNPTERY